MVPMACPGDKRQHPGYAQGSIETSGGEQDFPWVRQLIKQGITKQRYTSIIIYLKFYFFYDILTSALVLYLILPSKLANEVSTHSTLKTFIYSLLLTSLISLIYLLV